MNHPFPLRPARRAALLLRLLPASAAWLGLSSPLVRGQGSPDETAQPSTDQVVQMEAFNVSTTIGTYHEETSSMATKVPTSLKELASSLQILNANALADRNVVTLQDVYSYIVGLTQTQKNVNGFSFRGFSNTGSFTQNIEYDGLQGAVSQKGGLSAANVESVEFLKGPNSVLYGQMQPGGLMNIVTKSPQQKRSATFSVTYQTFGGQYDSLGAENSIIWSADLTGPIDRAQHWLYRLVVSEQDLRTWRKGDWEKDVYVYPSLTYRWSNDTYLTFKVEASRERARQDDGLIPVFPGATQGPTAGYVLAAYNTVYQEPTDFNLNKGQAYSTFFQTRFADNWTLRFHNRTVYHRDDNREDTLIVAGTTTRAANPIGATTYARQFNHQDNGHRYCYFDANLYGVLGPKKFENTILIGTGGGAESFDQFRRAFGPNVAPISVFHPVFPNPYPAEGTKTADPKQYLTNFGAYASDMIRIADRLHVTIGTRYSQQVAHGFDPLNPTSTPYGHAFEKAETSQVGVVYDVTSELSPYASASQSFFPNDVTRVDANGNHGFPPQKGYQLETGLKFETPDHNLFASACVYFISQSNLVSGTGTNRPDGEPIFRIDGENHSEGGEFESEWRPINNLQLQAGLSLNKEFVAQSIANPKLIGFVGVPKVSANLWGRYNIPKGILRGLGIGIGCVYTGSSWVGDPSVATPFYKLPGWARVDGNLYYTWTRYEFALNVTNVLDRRYIQFSRSFEDLVPGDERKFSVSATARF